MYVQYQYIIKGEGMMALPVYSDLNYFEFENHIKDQTKKLHPKGHDTIWKWGVIEFINPEVMSVNDFMNNGPALIGIK